MPFFEGGSAIGHSVGGYHLSLGGWDCQYLSPSNSNTLDNPLPMITSQGLLSSSSKSKAYIRFPCLIFYIILPPAFQICLVCCRNRNFSSKVQVICFSRAFKAGDWCVRKLEIHSDFLQIPLDQRKYITTITTSIIFT